MGHFVILGFVGVTETGSKEQTESGVRWDGYIEFTNEYYISNSKL